MRGYIMSVFLNTVFFKNTFESLLDIADRNSPSAYRRIILR